MPTKLYLHHALNSHTSGTLPNGTQSGVTPTVALSFALRSMNLIKGSLYNIAPDSNGTDGTWTLNASGGSGWLYSSSGGLAGSGGKWYVVGTGGVTQNVLVLSTGINLIAGRTYTVSVYIDSRYCTVRQPFLTIRKSDATPITYIANTTAKNARVFATFVAPSDIPSGGWKIELNVNTCTIANGQQLIMSNPQIEEGNLTAPSIYQNTSGTSVGEQWPPLNTNAVTSQQRFLYRIFVSDQLNSNQTVGGGTLTFMCSDFESSLSANHWVNGLYIYVWRPSTGTKVGVVKNNLGPIGGLEPTIAASGRVTTFTTTSTAVAAQTGDLIICEVWATVTQAATTSYQVKFGYDGTDDSGAENTEESYPASFIQFSETLTFGEGAPPPPPPPSEGTIPTVDHVVMVVLQNHTYSEIIGNVDMPYLNGLISQNGLCTNYFAVTHPSIGNCFDLTCGQIITNNDSYMTTTDVPNIVRSLLAINKTWKAYSEGVSNIGYIGDGPNPYVRRHNPCSYFSDVVNNSTQKNNLVPFTQFTTDLANSALPNFSFLVPDLDHNMHDGTAKVADNWLRTNLQPLFNSIHFNAGGLFILVFDETENDGTASHNLHGGGQVVCLMIGTFVIPQSRTATFYQHPSVLRTICEALGCISPYPGSADTASAIVELFTDTIQPPPPPPPPPPGGEFHSGDIRMSNFQAGDWKKASVRIDPFPMRIPGMEDIQMPGGLISNLELNTLYYIYYDDPSFSGSKGGASNITYMATLNKEEAIKGPGRFFVGSIRTPKQGEEDTSGFGDGGSVQTGMINRLYFTTVDTATPYTNNSSNMIDGDSSTYGSIWLTNVGGGVMESTMAFRNPPALNRKYFKTTFRMIYCVPNNSCGSQYFSINIGIDGYGWINNIPGGQKMGITELAWVVPTDFVISGVIPRITLHNETASSIVELQIMDAWLQCEE